MDFMNNSKVLLYYVVLQSKTCRNLATNSQRERSLDGLVFEGRNKKDIMKTKEV
jgi:hypothetical protein